LTAFFGRILLINVALGVVTGIVQEFQFGMNWATYSRYVGDVFGAPLAIEGLVAFFLESSSSALGLRRRTAEPAPASGDDLGRGARLHPFGLFHPGRQLLDAAPGRLRIVNGRAEMTSLRAILTQGNLLEAFAHVISAAIVTAGALALAVPPITC